MSVQLVAKNSIVKKVEPLEERPTLKARIKYLVAAIFAYLFSFVANCLTLLQPLDERWCWERKVSKVNEQMELARREKIEEALDLGLGEGDRFIMWGESSMRTQSEERVFQDLQSHGISSEDAKYFASKVWELKIDVETLALSSVKKFYKKFQKFAKEKRFVTIFQKAPESLASQFLKVLAVKYRSADLQKLLVDYAKGIEQESPSEYSIQETGKWVAKTEKEVAFKRDNWKEQAWWAAAHPDKICSSIKSQLLPELYDATGANPTYIVHKTSYQKIPIHFIAGPTPFNDPVYRNILGGDAEFRINLMDSSSANEHGWIKNMHELSPDHHAVWGFKSKKKSGFLEHDHIDPLLDAYKSALLEKQSARTLLGSHQDNGILLPKALLSDEEIEKACDTTKELLKEIDPDLSTREKRHAAIVIADSFMSLKMLLRYLNNLSIPKRGDPDMMAAQVAIACKQCYDRGPVHFMAMLLFLRSLKQDQPLSEEEFYKIAGLPLFRSPVSEGRAQMASKSAVYKEFASMLGDRFDLLSKYCRNYCNNI